MEKDEGINIIITQLVDAWGDLTRCLLSHPDKLAKSQFDYWQDYIHLLQGLPLTEEPDVDKRFKHAEWTNNILLNFVKKTYFLTSQHIENLVDEISDDEKINIAKKMHFFTRQFLDAISPSNFANLNPDVLHEITETNGENLINGFRQLLKDIEQSGNQLNIVSTDITAFKIGENIALTPGKVIYQNDLMQLILYTPTTESIYQIPLLIIPPWVNKYYILDLQQENSLVKWLVDQGFTVFMISWVNPMTQHKDKQFVDYMSEGPLVALDIIKKLTGEKQANILGYCIGGTLLGCMLAHFSKKQDASARSATFLTTLFDFSEPGELGIFTDEKQISLIESYMQPRGYLDGRIMATIFNVLRANDLIWASFINNYLKGQKPKPFDLLYWNADATNIPEKVHSFYLRNMYLNNLLIQKNKLELAGTSLDLSEITTPSYFLAAQDDHIVPWASCYNSSQILGGNVKFVLTSSGHVAGVVNPPHRQKYGYWVNQNNNMPHENFIDNAVFTKGSWWNDWAAWLKEHSGDMHPSKKIKLQKKNIIESAPGSYVKTKLEDLNRP